MAAVIYPPTITTDLQKLHACYSLFEQFRLEHNRQGATARSNPEKYIKSGKWWVYALRPQRRGNNIFATKYEPILAEIANLREKIRKATYTEEQWSKLSIDEMLAANLAMYGDKETLKQQPTLASSPLLTELQAINLDDIQGVKPKGTENFTAWTEQDTGGYLSVAASQVTFTNLPQTVDAYVYDDKGVDHFNGDFEILVEGKSDKTGGVSNPFVEAVALANIVNDFYYITTTANEDALAVQYRPLGGGVLQIMELEYMGGSGWGDSWTASENTVYYLRFKRVEGSPSNLYTYIYSDSARTVLEDTLALVLHEDEDFRYIFTAQNWNSGNTGTQTGHFANMDLQEGGVSVAQMSQPMGAKLIAGKLI